MNYYELRSIVAKTVPRMTQLFDKKKHQGAVREKGRKSGYEEYKLLQKKWVKQERLLNVEEINSFAEISCRAAACPMPLNLDVWDGLLCIAKGQKIVTNKGNIPIEKIKVGDTVLSFNEKTKKTEWKKVTNTSSTIKTQFVEINTKGEKVLVTKDHPVYTQRGWVLAENLTIEDSVLTYGAR